MITERDLQEAIAECEGQKNPNSNTCIKLAAFYTIMNNLYSKKEITEPAISQSAKGYSYSAGGSVVNYDGKSDFAQVIEGMDVYDLIYIMDELMETLKVLNPRLYDAVIRKLSDS